VYFDKVLHSAKYHRRPEKRIEMIYILGRLRDERALDTLEEFLAESDPYLVLESVCTIAEIGGPKAARLLKYAKDHRYFIVREKASQALDALDSN
jgi:HEAT repeat protein